MDKPVAESSAAARSAICRPRDVKRRTIEDLRAIKAERLSQVRGGQPTFPFHDNPVPIEMHKGRSRRHPARFVTSTHG